MVEGCRSELLTVASVYTDWENYLIRNCLRHFTMLYAQHRYTYTHESPFFVLRRRFSSHFGFVFRLNGLRTGDLPLWTFDACFCHKMKTDITPWCAKRVLWLSKMEQQNLCTKCEFSIFFDGILSLPSKRPTDIKCFCLFVLLKSALSMSDFPSPFLRRSHPKQVRKQMKEINVGAI